MDLYGEVCLLPSMQGSMDQVQGEIVQMKALIDEQNKRQDVLLHFIEQTMVSTVLLSGILTVIFVVDMTC